MATVTITISDEDKAIVEAFTGQSIEDFIQHRADTAVANYKKQAADADWENAKPGETVKKA